MAIRAERAGQKGHRPKATRGRTGAPSRGAALRLLQRAEGDPGSLSPQDVLQLQRVLGNRQVGQLLQRHTESRAPNREAGKEQATPDSQADPVIQRKEIETMGGVWEDLRYTGYKKNHRTQTETLGDQAFTIAQEEQGDTVTQGADMKLEFTPNASVNASKVGLTQTIRSRKEGNQPFPLLDQHDDAPLDKHGYEQRTVANGQNMGTGIDRMYPRNNPIYGASDHVGNLDQTEFAPQEVDNRQGGEKVGGIFNRYGSRVGNDPPVSAVLSDTPQRTAPLPVNAKIEFETTALALAGAQTNTYYGSVRWGYQTDGNGNLSLIEFEKVNEGNPTPAFVEAAQLWNQAAPKYGRNLMTQAFVRQGNTVQLPIPNQEQRLPLPTPAQFNLMKTVATKKNTPFSGALSRKNYKKYHDRYNNFVQQENWQQALVTIQKLRGKLDDMNNKPEKYWESPALKQQYFAPIYNAVKAQERFVEGQLQN